MEYMVLDYTDAFFRAPLHPAERKFFTAFFNGRFMSWNRIAQGSKNGPQLFGRLSALVARLTQGVFDTSALRLHVYIDDPIAILRGSPNTIRRMKAKLILIWRALSLDLAFGKGQPDSAAQWVGHTVTCDSQLKTVSAQIKPEFLADLGSETQDLLKKNTVQ